MNPVVAYLQENSVESLQSRGIYARWSTLNPRKFSLNYAQIEAINGDVLVEHCRGLVLRQYSGEPGGPGEYGVLAWPMRRFYNHGQLYAAPVDWQTARYYTKLDGTLCGLYFDPDLQTTCVCTRSIPDADVPSHTGETFAQMFWRTYKSQRDRLNLSLWNATVWFELTGPENQIVIPYDDWSVTQITRINVNTGKEEWTSEVPYQQFPNVEAAIVWAHAQPGNKSEGLVACDASFNRIKIKGAPYLALSKVMTMGGSDRGLVEIILSGTADDTREMLPKLRQERLDFLADRIRTWASHIDAVAHSLRVIKDRKDVALSVSVSADSAWMGTIMSIWQGKAENVSAWLESMKKNGEFQRSLLDKVTAEVA